MTCPTCFAKEPENFITVGETAESETVMCERCGSTLTLSKTDDERYWKRYFRNMKKAA